MGKNDKAIEELMANVLTGWCSDDLHENCTGTLLGAPCSCQCHQPTTEMQEVGKLNFKGDVRHSQPAVELSPRYGMVQPSHSEYDEETNRTTIHYQALVEVQPDA